VGLGVSKGRHEPSTNSPAADVPQENPSEVDPVTTHLVEVTEVPRKEVKEQETNHLLKEIDKIFSLKNTTFSHRHNHYECQGKGCNRLSEKDVSRLSTRSRDKFPHSWLSDKSLSFCQTTGVFWLIYEEAQGMFCFLCKKDDTENKENKSKAYNVTPSVRFKKSAIKDHSASQQHKDAIEAEMLSCVSLFHKEITEKEKVKDMVLMNAFLVAYWISKEEIANCKLSSLVHLLKIASPENMKFFN